MNINSTTRPATIMEIYTNKVYCISNNEGGFTPVIEKKLLQQIDGPSTNISNNPFPKIPLKYKVTTFWHQHGEKVIIGAVVLTIAVMLVVELTKEKESKQ